MRETVRVRVRVSECGRKIRNANRMPKSDDRTESNLRRGRREEGREGGRKTRRGGGVSICTRSKETLLSQE